MQTQSTLLVAILFALILLFTPAAKAQENSKLLLQSCTSAVKDMDGGTLDITEQLGASICRSYFKGYVDALLLLNTRIEDKSKRVACMEDTFSIHQLIKIYLKFLKENPWAIEAGFATTVPVALALAFPCEM